MLRPSALVLTLVVCAASASSPSSPSAPAASAATYRFDWSPPCRVPVIEKVEKKGQTAVASYDIDVRVGSDGNLEVRFENYRFLELGGQDVTGPEWKERLAPVLAMSTLPPFVVTPAGEFVEMRDLASVIDTVLGLSQLPADQAAEIRDMMKSPQMQATVQGSIAAYWETWVGAWLGWSVAPGAQQASTVSFDTGDGATAEAQELASHAGFDGRYARLSTTRVLRDDELFKLMQPTMRAVGGAPSSVRDLFTDGAKETTLSAEIDPAGLRPRRTVYIDQVSLRGKDGSENGSRTSRELTWDWSKAVGCGAK